MEERDEVLERLTEFIKKGNGELVKISKDVAVVKQEVKNMRQQQDKDFKELKDGFKNHNGRIRKNERDISSIKTSQKISITILISILTAIAIGLLSYFGIV
jgi:hypothetical protein